MYIKCYCEIKILLILNVSEIIESFLYKNDFVVQMIGVGSVLTTPLIGNLSDRYGRKALITLPLTVSLIPQGTIYNHFNSF